MGMSAPPADRLGISITERSDQPPALSYFARPVVVVPELDLAVLQIVADVNGRPDPRPRSASGRHWQFRSARTRRPPGDLWLPRHRRRNGHLHLRKRLWLFERKRYQQRRGPGSKPTRRLQAETAAVLRSTKRASWSASPPRQQPAQELPPSMPARCSIPITMAASISATRRWPSAGLSTVCAR